MPSALTFSLCGVRLGIDVHHVREVLPCVRLVHPPETPHVLRGFLNLRGEMVPVLRLESVLQLALQNAGWDPEEQLQSRIVVARLGDLHVAWLADEGVELLRYEAAQTVRLPADHVLNNCADRVVARPAPEMSIVLLSPSKVLLEGENLRLRQLTTREKLRQEAFELAEQEA
ncbi:chemotaxis protein CheW [Verrucomicrobium sp. BvORR034]|uniref:chemotaxis protein CheW n=1 Tax=Verrucomicrobium sp. BvORR034 TaxID=1396418 RepID=UPI0006794522|nr:chemotaxis protein CheW [Verrucomicrobium sp. BvORR034]